MQRKLSQRIRLRHTPCMLLGPQQLEKQTNKNTLTHTVHWTFGSQQKQNVTKQQQQQQQKHSSTTTTLQKRRAPLPGLLSMSLQEHQQCLFVPCLLHVPAACSCISGTDLLRQTYVLPHRDRRYRENSPFRPIIVADTGPTIPSTNKVRRP